MKTKVLLLSVVAIVILVSQPCIAAKGSLPLERYIVHTADNAAVNEAAQEAVENHAGLVLKRFTTGKGVVVLIPRHAKGPMGDILGVVAVEPDLKLKAVKKPTNKPKGKPQPPQPTPYGVDRIDADLAWPAVTGAGVGIAIIDTGIDKDHLDLQDNIAGGMNFVVKLRGRRVIHDPDAWGDDNGHGTHVAGIAAAVDNTIGVVGVAPEAGLYGVKVLGKDGSGYLSDIVDGIEWAVDNANIHVINLSLGIDKETLDHYPNDKALLDEAINYAYDSGLVVVAAAGNEGAGDDTVIYPARFDGAIAVAATDSADNRAVFSSTGPSVELAAPGVAVYSAWKSGYYNTISGTSMSSPHVAATAALVLASGITDTNGDGQVNDEVRAWLRATADDIGPGGVDDLYGYGLVDAQEAATGTEILP